MPRNSKKNIVSRLTPRLRHDCVLSNDAGSVKCKGLWYRHEGFHSSNGDSWKARMAATNNSLIADGIYIV